MKKMFQVLGHSFGTVRLPSGVVMLSLWWQHDGNRKDQRWYVSSVPVFLMLDCVDMWYDLAVTSFLYNQYQHVPAYSVWPGLLLYRFCSYRVRRTREELGELTELGDTCTGLPSQSDVRDQYINVCQIKNYSTLACQYFISLIYWIVNSVPVWYDQTTRLYSPQNCCILKN